MAFFPDSCPLHPLEDLDGYQRLFTDVELWRPYVRMACRKAHLPCEEVHSSLPGTFPTFLVDQSWVVKFFGQLFEGEEAYRTELHAYQILAGCADLPIPSLIAPGVLFEDRPEGRWPFLIFEYLPGMSVGEVFEQMPEKERHAVAVEMGHFIHVLHSLPLCEGPAFSLSWQSSLTALEELSSSAVNRQRAWGALPEHLLVQIEGYLAPPERLLPLSKPPFLIHADLTADHLLGWFENGRWITTGVIDWGDAWLGGFYYELVALYFDLLHAEPALLKSCLKAYKPAAELLEDFPRRALSAALLHRFNVFETLCKNYPDIKAVQTLEELADRLYGGIG